jgi:hypothetical protein
VKVFSGVANSKFGLWIRERDLAYLTRAIVSNPIPATQTI